MSESTHYLLYFLHISLLIKWHCNFLRSPMPRFKKGSSCRPLFSSCTTLSKCVVSHCLQLPVLLKKYSMVKATCHLFNGSNTFDFDWVILYHQFSFNLGASFLAKQFNVFPLWDNFLNSVDKNFSILTQNKHPTLCK